MSDRKALAAAIDQVMAWVGGDERRPTPNQILAVGTSLIAVRERLAQLPEKCPISDGRPHPDFPCEVCHGSGKVYPAELVERIAHTIRAQFLNGPTDYHLFAVAVLVALDGETP